MGNCDDGTKGPLRHLPRLFPCYPKFNPVITEQGYVTENYINGLSGTSEFLIEYEGRR